mgnify:CR=1 FL=1
MVKFITGLVSWFFIPFAMIAVAWDVAKCYVEDKILGVK